MPLIHRILTTLQREDDFILALATVDTEGLPHVRYMKGVIDSQLVIRCPTFAATQKVRQIQHCGDVSVTCGDTDSLHPGSYFQITAQATISQAPEDRAAAWTPRMGKWFTSPEDSRYAVIRIEPTTIVALPIGGGPASEVWNSKSGSTVT